MDTTRAEVCATALADLFDADDTSFASPMGLLPTLGARLAKLTGCPDLLLTDGEALLIDDVPPLGTTSGRVEGWMPFAKVFDIVAHGGRHVVMGATQLDRYGNQNISCIGDHDRPTRQLLGARGAPGNTTGNRTSYWVPKHSPRVFVEHVDMVCGVGPARARATGPAAARFNDVHRIVSSLGVFDLRGPDHTLRLCSVHPGVTVEEVRAASGCEIHADPEVPATRTPTDAERALIRDVLDPHALRDREVPRP